MGLNKIVPFSLSKLLKEKDFDLPVRTYRLEGKYSDVVHEGFEDDYWGDNRIVNWNKEHVGIKPFKGFVSAPTIAEALDWIYTKYGIWIWVERYSTLFRPYAEEIGNERFGKWEGHKYSSPEESYFLAIEYVLNNFT